MASVWVAPQRHNAMRLGTSYLIPSATQTAHPPLCSRDFTPSSHRRGRAQLYWLSSGKYSETDWGRTTPLGRQLDDADRPLRPRSGRGSSTGSIDDQRPFLALACTLTGVPASRSPASIRYKTRSYGDAE